MRSAFRNIAACLLGLWFTHSVCVHGAETSSSARFSGTWQAKVNGSVVCTFVIRAADKITGTMDRCSIHADAKGNLVEPDASDDDAVSKPSPISNARAKQAVLTFDCVDGEQETLRFEMTLVGDGVAQLHLKSAPVKIKPIRFVRLPAAAK